jgi:hypothetical protein
VLPEGVARRGRGYYGQIRNNFDHRTTAAVLEDGIVLLTCDRECGTGGGSEAERIDAVLLPGDGSGPEESIPLNGLLDPQMSIRTDAQIPVPGAVVVHQTDYGLEMLPAGVGEMSPYVFPETSEAVVGLV